MRRCAPPRSPGPGSRITNAARGPPLVMLMGTGSTMAEWDPALLRLLAADHRLILFDYPGVGRSGPWHGDSFDSLADMTAGLIEELGIERADVLGWSMGGFVAQRLAVAHPGPGLPSDPCGDEPGGHEDRPRHTRGPGDRQRSPIPRTARSSTTSTRPNARERAGGSCAGSSAPARAVRSPTTSTSLRRRPTHRWRPRIRGFAVTGTTGSWPGSRRRPSATAGHRGSGGAAE